MTRPARILILAAIEAMVAAKDDVAPTAMPPAATDDPDPGIPIFDRAAFEDIIGCLSPAEASDHLQALIARGEALSCSLRAPDMVGRADGLAKAAHKLAGMTTVAM